MLGGVPVEMITMLGSSLLGGFMSIWGQSIKAKQAEQKMLLARGKFQMDEIDKARRYENNWLGGNMSKLKDMWRNLSKKGKIFTSALIIILLVIIYSYIF